MAKLRIEQLAASLKKSLAPVYLISGEEPLLTQESADHIRQQARAQGFSERETYNIDNHFDWSQLLASANSLSLFAEKKIIELRMPSGKPSDKGTEALLEYLESPSPDNLLLIITDKLDASAQKSKWCKAIEEKGIHIQTWPVSGAQLPQWIQQRLQHLGLSADANAIQFLADHTQGNLLATAQELEKLVLLNPHKGHIDLPLITSLVSDSARFDMFELCDKTLAGDVPTVVRQFHGLRTEGVEIITILWAVTRDLRSLVQLTQIMDNGNSFGSAARQAGIWEKRQTLFQQAASRIKTNQAQHLLLRKARGIDTAIKGMRDADPWDELLDLLLNIAGVHSLSLSNQKLAIKL
jgi:DNA polymerase III subunit delta